MLWRCRPHFFSQIHVLVIYYLPLSLPQRDDADTFTHFLIGDFDYLEKMVLVAVLTIKF